MHRANTSLYPDARVAETKEHTLDDIATPGRRRYVREIPLSLELQYIQHGERFFSTVVGGLRLSSSRSSPQKIAILVVTN